MRSLLRSKAEANAKRSRRSDCDLRPVTAPLSGVYPGCLIGRMTRLRAQQGQKVARAAVHGTSPTASRPGPRGPVRRLGRPYPGRPSSRPHRRSERRPRGLLKAVSPLTPHRVSPLPPTPESRVGRSTGAVDGAQAGPDRTVSPPFRSPVHDPTRNHLRGLHAPPERARRHAHAAGRGPPAGHCLGASRLG